MQFSTMQAQENKEGGGGRGGSNPQSDCGSYAYDMTGIVYSIITRLTAVYNCCYACKYRSRYMILWIGVFV